MRSVSMRAILIFLLVVATLGLSGAGFLLLKNRQAEPVIKEIPKTYVMVPNMDLLRGHVIGPGDLAWMEWPSESANNFISSKQKDIFSKEFDKEINGNLLLELVFNHSIKHSS